MKGMEGLTLHTAFGISGHNGRPAAVGSSSPLVNELFFLGFSFKVKRRGKTALKMNPGEGLTC